ncbi:MAG: pyridoxal-phosphate dependent enzyme [Acidobacteriota bacterium]
MLSVSFNDVRAAAEILHGVVHITPVMTSGQLNEASGASVFLKCENFQRIGAFKFRGAYHAIFRLQKDDPRGSRQAVVTLSSGNHAQGVALACRLLGMSGHIVMQAPINPIKRAAVTGYGATIHEAPDRRDAEELLRDVLQRHAGHYVHAFNDPRVVAGQGTCMLEFLGSMPDLEVVLAPVGGGGLLSGTCLAAHGLKPSLQLYACEPTGALDAIHSVRENRIAAMEHPATIAEGLRTTLGDVTLPILREHLAGFYTVDEGEIVQALRFAFERLKMVIEPSAAVALAPLLRREPALAGKKVGVILTGGNVDLSSYFEGIHAAPP